MCYRSCLLLTVFLGMSTGLLEAGYVLGEVKQGRRVGHVETVPPACMGGGYIIERADTTPLLSAKDDHLLFENDRVVIKAQGCTLTIRYGSTRESVTSTRLIPSPSSISWLARAKNLFWSVSSASESVEIEEGHARGRKRTTDDTQLGMPILEQRGNYVRAGTRDLYLAWRGGPAPFSVELSKVGQEGPGLAHRDQVASREITFESVPLTPGRYQVTIWSADGSALQALLSALEGDQIPGPPVELMKSSEEDPPDSLLQALWLASEGNGDYVFEAFQQIAEIAKAYPEAKVFLEKLKAGWQPEL